MLSTEKNSVVVVAASRRDRQRETWHSISHCRNTQLHPGQSADPDEETGHQNLEEKGRDSCQRKMGKKTKTRCFPEL